MTHMDSNLSQQRMENARSEIGTLKRKSALNPEPRTSHLVRSEQEEVEAERKKLADEETRMLRTVQVVALHPRADERDIFEHFQKAGKVCDVQIIRDARTGKSRGVCYVEFADAQACVKSLALTGSYVKGQPIHVQQPQQGGR